MKMDSIDRYAIILCSNLYHTFQVILTIEMQHISISLVCLTINIQIYSVYNYISLINLCLNCNIRMNSIPKIQTGSSCNARIADSLLNTPTYQLRHNMQYVEEVKCAKQITTKMNSLVSASSG
jgi:hypothetical protein